MNLVYHKHTDLPVLAWCAVTKYGESEIHIYHGEGVDTFENFFVEGAWDGDFCSANFDSSHFFMGTGGKVKTESEAIFATPNHVLERLYSISENKKIYISNSLPFILYKSETKLDNEYLDYEKDFHSIVKGIKNYTRFIPLADNKKVQLHYYCNIVINDQNRLTEERKRSPRPFKNFTHYYERIMKTLRTFVKNSQSPERKFQFGMLTTISKGYDAAASAAIGRELGCDTTITFNEPQKFAIDSGYDIAKELGYENIVTKDANAYLQNSSLIEAEFVSSGELGPGIMFTSFENEFANNIVFLGNRGDIIWGKNRTDVNREMQFKNVLSTSTAFIENRLRVGYSIAPLPLFCAENWPSIHEISNSKEMKKYSIGGPYDRPIPRRIIEMRGIDREAFGMNKRGAGFSYTFDTLGRLKKRMSKKSFEDFYGFYKNNKRSSLKVQKHWLKYLWFNKSQYSRYLLRKLGFNIPKDIKADGITNPGAPSYLFNWGIERMKKRYADTGINESTGLN